MMVSLMECPPFGLIYEFEEQMRAQYTEKTILDAK